MSTATLALKHVRAAALFVDTKELRPSLRFIHIEPRAAGGVFVVATNGKRMFVSYDESGTCSEACSVSPIKLRSDAEHIVTFDGKRAETNFGEICAAVCAEYGSEAIGGRFPDWRVILPRNEMDKPVGAAFDAKLISDCAAVSKIFGDRYSALRFSGSGDDQNCFVVRFAAQIPAFLVVMPLRNDKAPILPGFPNWL